MQQLYALIKHWMRDRRWISYPAYAWRNMKRLYHLHFRKNKSYDVDGNLYNFLFHSPAPSLGILVDYRVWDIAAKRLPKEYRIPNKALLDVLLPMNGDYYSTLFSNSLPMRGKYVDGSVWKRIKTNLPEKYIIPDSSSIRIMEPMTAAYYDSLFTSRVNTPGIIVDGKVWGQITDKLPQSYRLPDPVTLNVLNKNKRVVGK